MYNNYFLKKEVPNSEQFRQLKAVAIKRMEILGMYPTEISKVIGCTRKNVYDLKKKKVDPFIIKNFDSIILNKKYPILIKNKLQWIIL